MSSRFWTRKTSSAESSGLTANNRDETETEISSKIIEERNLTNKEILLNSDFNDNNNTFAEASGTGNQSHQGLSIMMNANSSLSTLANPRGEPLSEYRNLLRSTKHKPYTLDAIKNTEVIDSSPSMEGLPNRGSDYIGRDHSKKENNSSSRLISSMISLDSTPIIPTMVGFDSFGAMNASEFLLDSVNISTGRPHGPNSPGTSYKLKVKKQYLDSMKSGNPDYEANRAAFSGKKSLRIKQQNYYRYQHSSPSSSPNLRSQPFSPDISTSRNDGSKFVDSNNDSSFSQGQNQYHDNNYDRKLSGSAGLSSESSLHTSNALPSLSSGYQKPSRVEPKQVIDSLNEPRFRIPYQSSTERLPSLIYDQDFPAQISEFELKSDSEYSLSPELSYYDDSEIIDLSSPNLSFAAAATARIFGTPLRSQKIITEKSTECGNNKENRINIQSEAVLVMDDIGAESITQELINELAMMRNQIELSNKRALSLSMLGNDENLNIKDSIKNFSSEEEAPVQHFQLELSKQQNINSDLWKTHGESQILNHELELLSLKNRNLRQEYDELFGLSIKTSDEAQQKLIEKINTEFDTLTIQNNDLLFKLDEIHYNALSSFSAYATLTPDSMDTECLEGPYFKRATQSFQTSKIKERQTNISLKSDTIEAMKTQRDLLKSSFVQLKLLNAYRASLYRDYCDNNLFVELTNLRSTNQTLRDKYLSLVDFMDINEKSGPHTICYWDNNIDNFHAEIGRRENGPSAAYKRHHIKSGTDKTRRNHYKKSRNFSPSGVAINTLVNSIKSTNRRYSFVMESKKKVRCETLNSYSNISEKLIETEKLTSSSRKITRVSEKLNIEYSKTKMKQSREFLPLRAATKDGMLMQE